MNKSGELMVLAGGILWGFSGACGEFLFSRGAISAHILVPYRLLISGLLCLILQAFLHKNIGIHIFSARKDLAKLLAFSICGISLCQYMYFWGIELSNAAIATVIQYSAPALIILISCIKEKRRPSLLELSALIAISAGVLLLATGGDLAQLKITSLALLVCSLSAIGAAAYALLPAQINARYGALSVLGWAMLLSGFGLVSSMQFPPISLQASDWMAFLAIILLGTVGAFSLFMFGLAKIGAAKASLISSIEPIAAAAIAWIWLGTSLDLVQLIGFCLIFFGVLLSFRR